MALSYSNRGLLDVQTGQPGLANKYYKKAVSIREEVARKKPGDADQLAGLAASYDNLGQLHAKTDLEEAICDCSHAIEIQETLCRSHPDVLKYRSDLAVNYSNLGAIEGRGGRFQQARASYVKALEIQEDLVRKSASVPEYVLELAVTHNNLGQLCLNHHDLPSAWKSFQDAKAHLDRLVENYPKEINYRSTLGGTLNNLGMTLEKLGRLDEALSTYQEAIKHQRTVVEIAPSIARFREFLGVQYGNFGRALEAAGRFEDALQAAMSRKRLWPKDPYRLFEVAADAATAAQRIDAAGAAIPPDKAKAKEAFSDLAVAALQEAVKAGMDGTEVLRNAADFRAIRGHPGYCELIAKLTVSEEPLRKAANPAKEGNPRP